MKVVLPVIVRDPEVTEYHDLPATEDFAFETADPFLDGPVGRRVAMLDFEPGTGALPRAVRFQPAGAGSDVGRYRVTDSRNLGDPAAARVAVFGTVLRTLGMFEDDDTLGRELRWGFDAPQLLIVPRAGEWANAFYERGSHSLQFFFFRPAAGGPLVYASHSQDIVAHETGHAVLDGIAPYLYDATAPQSLALHEAVADLTALLSAFLSPTLRPAVLARTGGSIQNSSLFSGIAEQFGSAADRNRPYLRDLLNNKSLDPDAGEGDRVNPHEPHDLSQVLSGALYTVMVNLHETLKGEQGGAVPSKPAVIGAAEMARQMQLEQPTPPGARDVADDALVFAAKRFKRTIFRALDYLPPGEVSFADYGRAILAADQTSHPDAAEFGEWIRQEFARRRMVEHPDALLVQTGYEHPAVRDLDLDTLLHSDWLAYDFATRNRDLLRIPPALPFKVLPRLAADKAFYHRDRVDHVKECVFKVSWTETEPNALGRGFPSKRQVTVGTTLVIEWRKPPRIRALLTPDRSDAQREGRDELLRRLVNDDLIRLDDTAMAPDGGPLGSVIGAEVIDGQLRVRGAARLLHLQPER